MKIIEELVAKKQLKPEIARIFKKSKNLSDQDHALLDQLFKMNMTDEDQAFALNETFAIFMKNCLERIL